MLTHETKNDIQTHLFKCPLCEQREEKFSSYLRHLNKHLRCDKRSFDCVFRGCQFLAKTPSGFSSHVSNCHRGFTSADVKEQLVDRQGAFRPEENMDREPNGRAQTGARNRADSAEDRLCWIKYLRMKMLKYKNEYSLPAHVCSALVDKFCMFIELQRQRNIEFVDQAIKKHGSKRALVAVRDCLESSKLALTPDEKRSIIEAQSL